MFHITWLLPHTHTHTHTHKLFKRKNELVSSRVSQKPFAGSREKIFRKGLTFPKGLLFLDRGDCYVEKNVYLYHPSCFGVSCGGLVIADNRCLAFHHPLPFLQRGWIWLFCVECTPASPSLSSCALVWVDLHQGWLHDSDLTNQNITVPRITIGSEISKVISQSLWHWKERFHFGFEVFSIQYKKKYTLMLLTTPHSSLQSWPGWLWLWTAGHHLSSMWNLRMKPLWGPESYGTEKTWILGTLLESLSPDTNISIEFSINWPLKRFELFSVLVQSRDLLNPLHLSKSNNNSIFKKRFMGISWQSSG